MAKISTNFGGGELAGVAPCDAQTITLVNPTAIDVNDTVNLFLNGTNFTAASTVSVTHSVSGTPIASIYTFLSSVQVVVTVTSTSETGFYNIAISNACNTVTEANAFEVQGGGAIIPGSAATPWDNC